MKDAIISVLHQRRNLARERLERAQRAHRSTRAERRALADITTRLLRAGLEAQRRLPRHHGRFTSPDSRAEAQPALF